MWWAVESNYFIVYKLFEFAVQWIPAVRNKAEITFGSKNHLNYCDSLLVNSKVDSLYMWYCAPHLSPLFKLNSFFSLAPYSLGIHNRKQKNYTCTLSGSWKMKSPSLLPRTIETFFRELLTLLKIRKWHI